MKFCFLLLLAFVPLCTAAPRPVIIDTDLDVDDMWAIVYLIKSPNVDVKAITVSGNGWSDPIFGVPNILYLLDYLGCPNTPVAYGANAYNTMLNPATVGDDVPADLRAPVDTYLTVCLNQTIPTSEQPSPYDAEELIISILENSDEPVDILMLGTATTVARALIRDRSIQKKIGAFFWSGASFDGRAPTPANYPYATKTKGSSWNVFLDPLAVQRIWDTGIPIYVYTSQAQADLVFNSSAIYPQYQIEYGVDPFLLDLVRMLPSCTNQTDSAINYWDPSAAIFMEEIQQGFPTSICTQFQDFPSAISVLVDGGYFGRTINVSSGGTPVTTCKHGNLTAFLAQFYSTLAKQSYCPIDPAIKPVLSVDDVVDMVNASNGALQAQIAQLQAAASQMQQVLQQQERLIQDLQNAVRNGGAGSSSLGSSSPSSNQVNINFAGLLQGTR